jgi:hypothetical protein
MAKSGSKRCGQFRRRVWTRKEMASSYAREHRDEDCKDDAVANEVEHIASVRINNCNYDQSEADVSENCKHLGQPPYGAPCKGAHQHPSGERHKDGNGRELGDRKRGYGSIHREDPT